MPESRPALKLLRPALSRFSLGRRSHNLAGIADAIAFLLLLSLSVAPSAAFAASSPTPSATLTSPDVEEHGGFGDAVAVDGSYRVVGSPGETVNGTESAGSAYVYSASSGSLLYTLTSPNPEEDGAFGDAVAVSGNLVVVGAHEQAANGIEEAGDVYVYEASTGKLLQTLTSPNAIREGYFGISVAVSGEDVVVGAVLESVNGHKGAGRAYIFSASSGELLQTLTSPTPQAEGGFGISVAIEGEDVVVGAYGETSGGYKAAGNAYVFSASSGTLLSTLTSPNAQEDGRFGSSVAIGGEDLVVGAYAETAGGYEEAGNAYVFSASSGELLHTLTSPNPGKFADFPTSVAISGEDLLLGEERGTAAGFALAGDAYVYSASGGELLFTLTSPNPQEHKIGTFVYGGEFGGSVAISGDSVLVGAKNETSQGLAEAGNAYVFSLSATTAPSPSVSEVQPAQGPTSGATKVTVKGENLTDASSVMFGEAQGSEVDVLSATELTVRSPAHGVGTVDVVVSTPGGQSAKSTADHYTYVGTETPSPSVSKVEPAEGPASGGTRVTVKGENLMGASSVVFGEAQGSEVDVLSATELTVRSPAHGAGTVDVVVTTPGGQSAASTADHYTYIEEENKEKAEEEKKAEAEKKKAEEEKKAAEEAAAKKKAEEEAAAKKKAEEEEAAAKEAAAIYVAKTGTGAGPTPGSPLKTASAKAAKGSRTPRGGRSEPSPSSSPAESSNSTVPGTGGLLHAEATEPSKIPAPGAGGVPHAIKKLSTAPAGLEGVLLGASPRQAGAPASALNVLGLVLGILAVLSLFLFGAFGEWRVGRLVR